MSRHLEVEPQRYKLKDIMYILEAYKNNDKDRIVKFIKENSFADLVTSHEGVLCSNKVPFLYDEDKNELYGHLGKGNEQLIGLQDSEEVLIIFSGAHSYISPQWYVSKNAVPTWNFQTLQCRGKPSLVDKVGLMEILAKLTKYHESSYKNPWTMARLDSDKKEMMVNLLTGFKIEVTDIKFKEKMSQIRDLEDRKNIINELEKENSSMSQEVSKIMRDKLEL